MKKIILTSIVVICCVNLSLAQNIATKRLSPDRDNTSSNINRTSVYVPPVFNTVIPDTSGAVPGLLTYFDYVTNGNNLKKLWVLGDTILVSVDYSDSANAQISNARHSAYQVSYDGGSTWEPSSLQMTDPTAYPDMIPIFFSGQRTISISGRKFEGVDRRGYSGYDLGLGFGTFTTTYVPQLGNDLFSALLSSTEIGGAYFNPHTPTTSQDTINFIKFNFTTSTFFGKIELAYPPAESDANARTYIAATANGQKIYVMWWVSTAGNVRMLGKESTNGGTSFATNPTTILAYNSVINGDQVEAWFPADLVYNPNTSNICVALSTLGPGNFATAGGSKLLFWAPDINGGNPVNIADKTNFPTLMDTVWWNNSGSSLQVGMTAISHPSLAFSSDGTRLFCVFSGVQKDSSSYNFLFNDIWACYSDNGGATWSAPFKFTNTANVDEIYPTISKTGNTTTNVAVTYSLSECPGATSFSNNTTPICPVWQIYKRYNIIGVKPISSEVPRDFVLHQNYPNPFNPTTKIRFELPVRQNVTLKVFDVLGREVSTLVNNENLQAGTMEVDVNGTSWTSGVYFYTLKAGDFAETRKMILVK